MKKSKRSEFNNGFITAIILFLEHKNMTSHLPRDGKGDIICDLRLYGATDHLYDIEIPKNLNTRLKARVIRWRMKCFSNRLEHFKTTNTSDKLFKEAEDILAYIDNHIFHTKKVNMRYR